MTESQELYARGLEAFRRGETAESATLSQQALDAATNDSDRARAHIGLTRAAFRDAAYAEGLRLAGVAERLASDAGDEELRIGALHMRAEITRAQGEYAAAAPLYRELIALDEARDDAESLSMEHYNLGSVHLQLGELDDAESHLTTSLRLITDEGHNQLAYTLLGLAGVAARRGDRATATRVLGAVDAHFDRIGEVLDPAEQVEHASHIAAAREGNADYEAAYAEGRALPLDEAAYLFGVSPK